ncbi:hypothetical protein AAY473_038108 [Plecturocebus cupreus]
MSRMSYIMSQERTHGVLLCCPEWSAMAQSWLPETSISRVQMILLLQPPNLINVGIKFDSGQGPVVHACKPAALWEAEVGGSPEVRSLRLARPTWQNLVSNKNTKKSSRGWEQGPVIPVTWEAEAGELLEPRRLTTQEVEVGGSPEPGEVKAAVNLITPLDSSLGDRVKNILFISRNEIHPIAKSHHSVTTNLVDTQAPPRTLLPAAPTPKASPPSAPLGTHKTRLRPPEAGKFLHLPQTDSQTQPTFGLFLKDNFLS